LVRGAFLATALWLVGVAILPLGAGAAVRTKVDRPHELRFALDGRTLTLTIVDLRRFSQHPTTQSELLGKRVRIACGTSFRKVDRTTLVMSTVRWPHGQSSISVQLARDISRRVVWCVVETTGRFAGGDIASVSFYKAEPGRRLASGRLSDGTRWRLAAWRGDRHQPCLRLRVLDSDGTQCFDDEAETEAGIEAVFDVPVCTGETFVLGAVSRAATRVDIRMGDGSVVPAVLHPRPRGSQVRAQYFTALLRGPAAEWPPDVSSVAAYDARGRVIARDRAINGSGVDCGRRDER
jgi:hypothetical protein